MAFQGAYKTINHAVKGWEGVTEGPPHYGATVYRLGRREVGHIHGDSHVDIPFPRPVRDSLVDSGDAVPHHILPQVSWVSVFLECRNDVEKAIALLRKSYDAIRLRDGVWSSPIAAAGSDKSKHADSSNQGD